MLLVFQRFPMSRDLRTQKVWRIDEGWFHPTPKLARQHMRYELAWYWHRGAGNGGPVLFVFRLVLLSFKFGSASYWFNYSYRHLTPRPVDFYCLFQVAALLLLLTFSPSGWIVIFAGYVLGDMFLNIANIVFIGREYKIHNLERSILLSCLSMISLLLGFGVAYRWTCSLRPVEATIAALHVLGTMEFPQWAGCESEFPIATSLQIFCNIFLLLVVFAGFVGQLRFDEKDRT